MNPVKIVSITIIGINIFLLLVYLVYNEIEKRNEKKHAYKPFEFKAKRDKNS